MSSSLLRPSPSPSPRLLLKTPFTISSTSKSHSSLRFLSSPSFFNRLPLSLSSSRIRSSTPADPDGSQINITDELEPKTTEPEPDELEPKTTESSLDSDPPKEEDEWDGDGEQEEEVEEEKEEEEKSKSSEVVINGSVGPTPTSVGVDEDVVSKEEEEEDKAADVVADLKRCLVDSVYGLNLGFNASMEVRAEVLELVNQLEALNPTPNPVERADLLDGNWGLL